MQTRQLFYLFIFYVVTPNCHKFNIPGVSCQLLFAFFCHCMTFQVWNDIRKQKLPKGFWDNFTQEVHHLYILSIYFRYESVSMVYMLISTQVTQRNWVTQAEHVYVHCSLPAHWKLLHLYLTLLTPKFSYAHAYLEKSITVHVGEICVFQEKSTCLKQVFSNPLPHL